MYCLTDSLADWCFEIEVGWHATFITQYEVTGDGQAVSEQSAKPAPSYIPDIAKVHLSLINHDRWRPLLIQFVQLRPDLGQFCLPLFSVSVSYDHSELARDGSMIGPQDLV